MGRLPSTLIQAVPALLKFSRGIWTLMAQVVKNPPCSAGDPDLIPGSERSLEENMATHSSILAWKIPWTEEAGGLQRIGLQRVGHD